MERLGIFTLGGVRILLGDKPIAQLNSRKAEALLIYLASTRQPQPREMLADLLWNERTQSQASSNLRTLLTELRHALGESLSINRETVAINPDAEVWLDSVQLDESLQEIHKQGKLTTSNASLLTKALELYRGDFLTGFSVFDCKQFEEWQVRERERLHQLMVDGLSELVAYEIEAKEYQAGIKYATRLLELDPLMENAHRQMMMLLANNGQRAAALNQYETCQKLLQAELGVELAEETRNLYEQIRTGKQGMSEQAEQLPSGTITFLFTDIEGSTRLLEQLRAKYVQVLAEHHKLLREIFQRHHGYEVDTEGDAFFVAFTRAADAIECVIDAQQCLSKYPWPQGASVRVRMGLHTGEPLVAHTGYIGMDVHRASRIAHVGYGGQVLLSQTTRDLIYQDLPPETRLRDLGAHMLKDIRFPQEIYQLEIPGLSGAFPPLKSLEKLEKEEEPPAPGKSPYMGLQYFDEADAEWFFGRKAVTDRLIQSVCSHRFLAVVGASGSGKSSVVRAGLIPAMKVRSEPCWQVRVITPTSHPLDSLALSLSNSADPITAASALIDDLQANPRSLYLYCQKNFSNLKEIRPLLVIDQFEELFTLCRAEPERLAFVNNLLYAVGIPDGALTVVITLRADFYEHLAQYVGLRELVSSHQVYIGVMNANELRQAIEEPAKRGGWELSPGLVDLILGDLGAGANRQPEPGALPLLSHALLETWKRRRGSSLNLKAYTEAGGVQGAIAKTAESVFHRDLDTAQQVIAKSIFLRLTELGEGTQDTRRRISIRELIPPGPAFDAEQIQAVLVKLADARLITTGEGTVEVAHEALIREWPTLREWLTSDRDSLRLHRHLTEAAQEWELLERDFGALYRGTRLNQTLDWAMANPRELNQQEQDFLEASREAAEREQSEREATRQRELDAAKQLAETEQGRAEAESQRAESERQRAEEQGFSAKRLRRRAWILAGVLVLALALAGVAVVFGRQASVNYNLASHNLATAQSAEQRALGQQATAESERLRAEGEAQQRATAEAIAVQKEQEALSRYLTSAAEDTLSLDPQLSAHLALEAIKADPTYRKAEETLHQVLPELRVLDTIPFDSIPITDSLGGQNFQRKLIRDGELLIQLTNEGIELVNMRTLQVSLLAPGDYAAFITSWDNRWLATERIRDDKGQEIDEIQVWEINTQKHLFSVPMFEVDWNFVGLITPSSAHQLLVYACYVDMTVHIWDVFSGQELYVLSGHAQLPDSYVFGIATQDGTRLATFDWGEGLVILWNIETGEKLFQFNAVSPIGYGFADFSPDGTHLTFWWSDNTIKVWDLTSTEPSLDFTIDQGFTQSPFLYSPDGTRLAAGSLDGLVRVWDAQTGELVLSLAGNEGIPWLHSFSQDGTRLYTGTTDDLIKEWDLTPSRELQTLGGNIGRRSFSPPYGERLALITGNSISIVESQRGDVLRSWQAHSGKITNISWSPDGSHLVTSSADTAWSGNTEYSVKIWDAATGELRQDLYSDVLSSFLPVDWSQNGDMVAVGVISTTLVWDPTSGTLLHTLQQPLLHDPSSWGISDIVFSPDGQKLATGSYNQTLVIWDTNTGEELFTIDDLPHSVTSLAFNPDGQKLSVGQTNGKILLYKLSDNGLEEEPTLEGGDQYVTTIAFNPDGTLLASGDTNGFVRVWDLNTSQLRLELSTFTDPITRVAFNPDGHLVASNAGGLTYFYALSQEELVNLARSRITRPMTPEECLTYLRQETCPEWP